MKVWDILGNAVPLLVKEEGIYSAITWHNRVNSGFVKVFKHYLLYLD